MKTHEQLDEMGRRYNTARSEGKTSREACDIVRVEFERPDLSDVSIRSYGSRARQVERPVYYGFRGVGPISSIDIPKRSFKILPQLVDMLEKEAYEKRISPSELLTLILMKRYC